MRIAVLANLKDNAPREPGMPADRWDDLDSACTTDAIVAVLQRMGHEADFFEASIHPPFNLIDSLRAYQPDLCFNLSESHYGDARESQVPALLEMLRLPYTGARLLSLALSLDKSMTKRLLHYHGLPTPEFQLFHHADDPIHAELLNEDGELRFPLFVKPNAEGTSIGVGPDSIVRTVADLRQRVAGHLAKYHQPILVERFIAGREVLVGLVGNVILNGAPRHHDRHYDLDGLDGLTFLPALEIDYAAYGEDHAGVYTNDMKLTASIEEYHYHCPAALSSDQLRQLQALAAAAFLVTGCQDVARVDFRLDETGGGKPYILEINPLPGLSPGYSDLCLEALAMGWDHDRLIGAIVEAAIARHGLQEPALAAAGD